MQTKANEGKQMLLRARLTALALGDLTALTLLRPRFGALAGRMAQPHAWVRVAGVDGALVQVAGAALWVVAAWLGTGLLAGLAGRLPGAAGAAGRALAQRVLPGALYRLVAGGAGLGVLLSPVAALAVPTAIPTAVAASELRTASWPEGPTAIPTAAAASELPTPSWPRGSAALPTAVGVSRLPTPTWPGVPAAATSRPHVSPAAPTARVIPAPAWPGGTAPAAHRPHPPDPPTPPEKRVTVRPGDSLWRIAARHLDAPPVPERIAHAWPRWYAANRAVVGPDPSLIRPGQVLRPPEVRE
jgi:hypothetical protein